MELTEVHFMTKRESSVCNGEIKEDRSLFDSLVDSSNGSHSKSIPLSDIEAISGNYPPSNDYFYLRQKKKNSTLPENGKYRIADLFCGCGGLSLGALEACSALGLGFSCIAAIDIDSTCLGVYSRNFGNSHVSCEDINHIIDGSLGSSPTASERSATESYSNIDLLLAGPPCQGNSDLNNHTRRIDERNSLYTRVARFAELCKPRHIIIENVPTVTSGKDKVVDRTISVLQKEKYITDSGVANLVLLGVPQKRKRHILIASRSCNVSLSEFLQRHRIEIPRSVWWAIHDLENEPPESVYSQQSEHSETNYMRMKYLHDNGLYDLPDYLRPACHKNKPHTYKSMYGRLQKERPSQTITSGFGSPGQGRFVHPTQIRTLTPHEAARLQFFPDWFDFSSVKTKTSLSKMIGNAVPMKLSYALSLELIRNDLHLM